MLLCINRALGRRLHLHKQHAYTNTYYILHNPVLNPGYMPFQEEWGIACSCLLQALQVQMNNLLFTNYWCYGSHQSSPGSATFVVVTDEQLADEKQTGYRWDDVSALEIAGAMFKCAISSLQLFCFFLRAHALRFFTVRMWTHSSQWSRKRWSPAKQHIMSYYWQG